MAVSWAGHASWVVRTGGLTVLTDPARWRRTLGTPARTNPVGVPLSALPRVDAVVISHHPYDRLDAPTPRRLPCGSPVFAPAGLAAWFRRRRFTRVTELDRGEAAEPDGVRSDFAPGPPLVRAHPPRHLPQSAGRLGAHRRRGRPLRTARLSAGPPCADGATGRAPR
ncbi:hypothetical protein SZN_27366 [Streptomyces zinciresistens K42]|uniref:Metallo-beta-lactamase domain-containing protein n=1 Tax=Streptomyces zinciresistens K42 TaxID=700597 RepID=G2GIY3_9ACTN|nr:hypothetical protein SZN_27366 [Streptomyces zinciresistens K42]